MMSYKISPYDLASATWGEVKKAARYDWAILRDIVTSLRHQGITRLLLIVRRESRPVLSLTKSISM